jgi:hypothetical protein
MKRDKVKLTKEQLEKMRSGLQDIVQERSSLYGDEDPEDQAKDKQDLLLIASVKSVKDAIEVLECLDQDLESALTEWAGVLDPRGVFEAKDDSHEEQERFRQYLHETYGIPMDRLRPT